MSVAYYPSLAGIPTSQLSFFTPKPVKSKSCRLISWKVHSITNSSNNSGKRAQLQFSSRVTMCSSHSSSVTSAGYRQHKAVWIWTESKQVMTAAVERGWNTFIFPPDRRELATEWSSIALIHPLFIEEGKLFDSEGRGVATFYDVTSPQQLQLLQPEDKQADNISINLLDWQKPGDECGVLSFIGWNPRITTVPHSKTGSVLGGVPPTQGGVIWTESKQVMTAAIERGWNTTIFPPDR